MSSHKAHQRAKQRGDRDKAKPTLQQSAPPRVAQANGKVAPTTPPPVPPAAAPSPPSHIPDAPSTPEPVPAEMNRAAEPAPSVAVPVSPAPHRGAHTNGDGHHTKHITQRTPTPPGELSEMFSTLRELFVQDRSNASRPDATRCGVCYLTFPRDQLIYREVEGYYACADCAAALNGTHLPMLRRQRK